MTILKTSSLPVASVTQDDQIKFLAHLKYCIY